MTQPPKPLQIEFVSDVVCPWCVVGLGGLETALRRLTAVGITAEIRFQPFELNPDMAPEGEWLISGGQPAPVFEEALRKIAGEVA